MENHRADALNRHLFSDPQVLVYAMLDGASLPTLRDQLYTDEPEYFCMFSGKLEPDMEEVAPYLVRLKTGSAFSRWLFSIPPETHYGIFIQSDGNLRAMRKHLRRFLSITDPDGKSLGFRYYDPRVFRAYLPTCNAEETEKWFKGISCYLLEGEKPGTLLRIWPDKEAPRVEEVLL